MTEREREIIIKAGDRQQAIASQILKRIDTECAVQIERFGKQGHHPLYWYAILGEEVGEVGKALVENDLESYEQELIQVAATCVSMIESLYNSAFSRPAEGVIYD